MTVIASAGALTAAPLPAQAATGPASADGDYAFTAELEIGDGDSKRACTGALVEAQWVLTAASCFAADPQKGPDVAAGKPPFKTVATIGRTDLSGTGGHVSEVVDLVPRAGRDMVMARLAQPAKDITPVATATAPVAKGDALTVAGFGRTKTEWVPGKLHTAAFTVNAAGDTDLDIAGMTANDGICKGDTGAPLLRVSNGKPELVAVASRSWLGGCLGESETRTDAIAARADNVKLGSRLTPGQKLLPGDTLASASARLTMQAKGNLVITSNAGKPLWSTGTDGNEGATARLDDNGNLVVRNAADTATLWESKTAAPGGQAVLNDRGNLVIYNAKNESLWSSGSARRHDYNGDGRDDIGAWYDFEAGSDATYTFFGNEDGSIGAPKKSYTAAKGAWEAKSMKFVTGDFNGDGRGDMAAARGYSDTSVKIWIALGKPEGGFDTPVQAWSAPAGSFHISYMTPQAGDFNGDGRDDLAVWYAYPDGTTKLWTYLSTDKGTLNAPFSSWSAPKDTWLRNRTKFITGDFNHDGRDEIGVFYGQGGNSVKTYVFTTQPNGGFTTPTVWWESDSLDWNRAEPHSGDFNGDGGDDALIWYDYPDGSDKTNTILVEKVEGKNRFGSAKVTLNSAPGNLDIKRLQTVIGDYDGDGRDDLAMMNHQADGSVKMWTWTARPDAMFNGGRAGWTAPATSWVYSSTTLLNTYN